MDREIDEGTLMSTARPTEEIAKNLIESHFNSMRDSSKVVSLKNSFAAALQAEREQCEAMRKALEQVKGYVKTLSEFLLKETQS